MISAYTIDVQSEVAISEEIEAKVATAVAHTLHQQQVEPTASLSVVLSDDESIRQLNQQFRDVDSATDVLSFPAGEPMPGVEGVYLGDIIMSVPYAQKQADHNGHALESELQLLAVHGTLHLLGYDHVTAVEKEEMWVAQTAVLTQLGLSAITPSEDPHD